MTIDEILKAREHMLYLKDQLDKLSDEISEAIDALPQEERAKLERIINEN